MAVFQAASRWPDVRCFQHRRVLSRSFGGSWCVKSSYINSPVGFAHNIFRWNPHYDMFSDTITMTRLYDLLQETKIGLLKKTCKQAETRFSTLKKWENRLLVFVVCALFVCCLCGNLGGQIWWSLAVEQRHAANDKNGGRPDFRAWHCPLMWKAQCILEHPKYHVILPVGCFYKSLIL